MRQAAAKDFEATLREVAAFGYEGVEVFDLHGREPERVAAWLEELGLVACSRHARLEAIETAELAELADESDILGWRRLVVSWVDPADLDTSLLARLAVAATAAHEAGLELGYHNHDAEVEQGFLSSGCRSGSSWSWTPAGPGTPGADPVSLRQPLEKALLDLGVVIVVPELEARLVCRGGGDGEAREQRRVEVGGVDPADDEAPPAEDVRLVGELRQLRLDRLEPGVPAAGDEAELLEPRGDELRLVGRAGRAPRRPRSRTPRPRAGSPRSSFAAAWRTEYSCSATRLTPGA